MSLRGHPSNSGSGMRSMPSILRAGHCSATLPFLYDSRKNVQRWWNTISSRDSWQQVVKDMQDVEEQYQMEELEQQEEQQQQWQWQSEPPPTYGSRTIRIDPRKQTGTESQRILVPPPSGGTISSSSFTIQQEQQPLTSETTYHGQPSPTQIKGSNFFTANEKTPAPSKQTNPTTQKPPSSVQSITSNFFTPAAPPSTTKMSQGTDTDKPTSKDVSSPTRPGEGSSKKSPDKLHLSDFYKASGHSDEAATLSKPTLSQQAPKTKPDDSKTPTSPYTRPAVQRDAYTSGPEVVETPSDQQSIEKTAYAQQPSEQAKKVAADQRNATLLPKHVAFKDIQDETASQVRSRGAKDTTKEAREADQKRAASAPSRELPPGSQNTPEAPSADLKVSGSLPMKKGGINEDDRFSTKRLRKMLEQSDPEALKPQSTNMQPTPITADERRSTSPLKGEMAADDRGATHQQKSPSINEQQPAPQMPRKSPPAPLQTPASDGRSMTLQGGIPDARGENEAVKPSIANPRGIYTTPTGQASTPGTQRQTAVAADQLADQAPPASSFADRRNEKTGVDEASQTATGVAEVQNGGRAPNSSGNKPIARSSETSREMSSSAPEKSMRQQQLQSDKSIISPREIGKQGSEAALPVSGTEKPKEREILTYSNQNRGKTPGQDLQESQEQTSPDTQQVKNNRNNSKSDGSTKPTQFDGNKGDDPES